MSIAPTTGQSGLPSVNETLEPEWVRHGSQATQKAYETALSFEQTLVEQLSKSLAATTETEGEGEGEGSGEGESGGGSAATSQLSSTLPQALSAGIMNAGGLGLAAQLTRDLPGAEATKIAPTSGGVSA